MRENNAMNLSEVLPWAKMATGFGLSEFEQDVLLLCLAPEIDLKYETIYAYLNNNVTRKWPTFDMALRLFSSEPDQMVSLRRQLLPDAPLFRYSLLLQVQPSPERPSWLSSGLSISPAVSHYILGVPFIDPALSACAEKSEPSGTWEELILPAGLLQKLRRLPHLLRSLNHDKPATFLIFEGRQGSGRSSAASAICRELQISLISIIAEALRTSPEPLDRVLQELVLHSRLKKSAVYLKNSEALFDRDGNPLPEGYKVVGALAQSREPVIFAFSAGIPWQRLLKGERSLAFQFGDLNFVERLAVWERAVCEQGLNIPQPTIEALADRFVLTAGEIKETTMAAEDACLVRGGPAESLDEDSLFEAARARSGQGFGNLAVKVATIHTWDNLVLPPATLRQVREVAAAIKNRHVVYSKWGFENRIASGRGLKVLFSGPSGTGKTMTAGVIARDLGLDLYKIDLSGIVSKYIGETEKNLDRIFRAACTSNAILFFDEADALFGKRSEVKDAHDRYANVEVAYLLMKMEEHEGAVILASNLSKNIDQAFSRRMHYVIDFPSPDDTYREKLWQGMFPPQVPLGDDVDFVFLAKQFEISGGDIKNIALDAAFLAAQDGQVVTMKELVRAMARQMTKERKVISATDFNQYYPLTRQD
jgi:AAA+ superfamily predicted ATPase